eukprot:TRINITY_DN754_c1_g1_i8.p1 TRINITY_DN754_c1_g1~~TRINITY_DN754_c1_g1_i8.p1  ORF type:complete len:502 (-),score=216.66 TRINITY_DN754_c1_g1_i8:79-1584(-)
MALKRKAVAKASAKLFKRSKGKASEKKIEEEVTEQEEPQEEQETQQEEPERQEDEIGEKEKLKQQEEQAAAARKKELKGMGAAAIKELLASNGLEMGNKADMIEKLLAHEAKVRALQREHEAKMRLVVVRKKEELEAMPASDLKDLCSAKGITGVLTKAVRIEKLLQLWQQDDGVNKGLAQMALEKRQAELAAKDKAALLKLCDKVGVEAFVKEVMVERLLRHELEAGVFARPAAERQNEEEVPVVAKKGDLVAALLASEANRKKEMELKEQQEEVAANKRKELKSMSVEELKKALSKRKLDPIGKKDDMVEALFQLGIQEEQLASREAELKAMGKEELKRLVRSKAIEATGGLEVMVQAVLIHEAKARDELKAYAARVEAVLAKKREELEARTAAELKDMCVNKGLKAGVGKEDRVERLLEEAKKDGEVDKVLFDLSHSSRREELLAMDHVLLRKLCNKAGVDALVKEVMVERLLSHEAEQELAAADSMEPLAKKARCRK